MYALIPALVSALFICYGLYVLRSRGPNRVGLTFFAVCATTFFWQASWALLFLTHNHSTAMALARVGYLPILFLPTTLYHFIIELTGSKDERPGLYASYLFACGLGLLLPTTDWMLSGLQHYFYGSYPKAGWLHPLHLAQTVLVIGRALWLLYRRQQRAVSTERTRLRYVLVSILIYFGAASDYLCNYGVEIYPPGVVFIMASLGLIAQAMVRHNLLADPMAAAATIAHEMRTPLASIRSQTRILARSLPELIAGYRPQHQERWARASWNTWAKSRAASMPKCRAPTSSWTCCWPLRATASCAAKASPCIRSAYAWMKRWPAIPSPVPRGLRCASASATNTASTARTCC